MVKKYGGVEMTVDEWMSGTNLKAGDPHDGGSEGSCPSPGTNSAEYAEVRPPNLRICIIRDIMSVYVYVRSDIFYIRELRMVQTSSSPQPIRQ